MSRGRLSCMLLISGGCGRLRMGLSRLWRGGECCCSARRMEETKCDCRRLGDELWLYMDRISMVVFTTKLGRSDWFADAPYEARTITPYHKPSQHQMQY